MANILSKNSVIDKINAFLFVFCLEAKNHNGAFRYFDKSKPQKITVKLPLYSFSLPFLLLFAFIT